MGFGGFFERPSAPPPDKRRPALPEGSSDAKPKEKKLPKGFIKRLERGAVAVEELEGLPAELPAAALYDFIERGQGAAAAKHLDRFQNVELERVFRALIKFGQADLVDTYLGHFPELNPELGIALIKSGQATAVASHLGRFPAIDHREAAEKMLATGQGGSLEAYLEQFYGLPREIAWELINEGRGRAVLRSPDSFNGLDLLDTAALLIKRKQGNAVATHIGNFPKELQREIVFMLIESRDLTAPAMAEALEHIDENEHKEIVLELAKANLGSVFTLNIERFRGLDRDLAIQLIDLEHFQGVTGNPDLFEGISHGEIAQRVMGIMGGASSLAFNLHRFRDLDGAAARDLISAGYGKAVAQNLRSFENLERSEAAHMLVLRLLAGGRETELADRVIATLHPDTGPDSKIAVYLDASVPKAIRNAPETYVPGVKPVHQRARLTHAMSPEEYADALHHFPELAGSQEPLKDAFNALLKTYELYGIQETPAAATFAGVAADMRIFGETFGPEAAMRFANRPGLSRHDAYLSAEPLGAFLHGQLTSENAETLLDGFGKVLSEVALDDASYEGVGTANHRFNQAVDGLSSNVERLLQEAEQLGLPGIKERVARLREPRFRPLGSWKGFKEAHELAQLLGRREVIEALRSPALPESVKAYGGALMAHPNVSMKQLIRFLSHPKSFLEAEGAHVGGGLQRSLAPARMLDVERLGLTAAELRNALADGTLDRLQILPPAEERYLFDEAGRSSYDEDLLRAEFSRAIGRQREKIKGEAKNPKGLFAELAKWGQARGLSKDECAAWIRGERSLPGGSDLTGLASILHDEHLGIAAPERFEIRVRVGRKSDPDMIVAGNDTSSCMPFGDGKTNVYAWGPGFAQLIVERKNEQGEWRTMAQSVLSLDFDAGRPATDVIGGLRDGEPLNRLVSAEAFARAPKLVCDNIEPAPNDIAAGRRPLIESAYKNFLRSYLERHAAALGIDPSEVLVGKETYLEKNRWTFPQVDNTFVPLAPLSYTDNAGEKAYRIETGLKSEARAQNEEVSAVKATDIMPMAFLEAKNYADNPNLVFGLYDRQHKIVGASIAAEKHGDPALSLISRDAKGVPVGYMIAYMDRTTDVPEVFIDDMAVDRSRNVLAAKHAIKILDKFLGRYAGHYRESGQAFPPIYAQMRETTSYRLLTRQAETLSKKFGLVTEIVEEGETSLGGETFKLVRIFVGADAAGLEASKKAFAERRPIGRPRDQGAADANEGYNENGLAE